MTPGSETLTYLFNPYGVFKKNYLLSQLIVEGGKHDVGKIMSYFFFFKIHLLIFTPYDKKKNWQLNSLYGTQQFLIKLDKKTQAFLLKKINQSTTVFFKTISGYKGSFGVSFLTCL